MGARCSSPATTRPAAGWRATPRLTAGRCASSRTRRVRPTATTTAYAGAPSARRRLARDAAAHGWSVRLLEDKARAANGDDDGVRRRRASRPRGLHPDQAEAIGRISDALGAALGTEVRVRPTASGTGYRAELDLASVDAALDLARRLRPRAVA